MVLFSWKCVANNLQPVKDSLQEHEDPTGIERPLLSFQQQPLRHITANWHFCYLCSCLLLFGQEVNSKSTVHSGWRQTIAPSLPSPSYFHLYKCIVLSNLSSSFPWFLSPPLFWHSSLINDRAMRQVRRVNIYRSKWGDVPPMRPTTNLYGS